MATTLIAILLVLLSMHALPDLMRFRRYGWLHDMLTPAEGRAHATPSRTLWITGLLLVATALIQAGLHRHWFGILELAFMVVVLYQCWGPRDLDEDIDAVLKAPDSERRRAAVQRLNDGISEQVLPFNAAAVVEASFAAALSRRFGVLFWFVLIGPIGAVGYRLVHLLARSPAFAEAAGDLRPTFERTALILDWLPAHLLAWTLALVTDFDASVRAWHAHHAAHGQGYFTLDLGFLGAIARAGVDADIAAGDAGTESIGDPLTELADTRVILRRALYAWIAVIAVIVIGGWAA